MPSVDRACRAHRCWRWCRSSLQQFPRVDFCDAHNGERDNGTYSCFSPLPYRLTMTTPKPSELPGNLTTFNIQHGFAEALLRGMRSSFLKDADYHHLTQCETLDDVKLNLTETDYADSIADMNTLTPNSLQKAAIEKVCFACSYLLLLLII